MAPSALGWVGASFHDPFRHVIHLTLRGRQSIRPPVRLIGKMREILSGILDYVQQCGAERGREGYLLSPDLASLTSISQHDVAAAEAVGSRSAAGGRGRTDGRTDGGNY